MERRLLHKPVSQECADRLCHRPHITICRSFHRADDQRRSRHTFDAPVDHIQHADRRRHSRPPDFFEDCRRIAVRRDLERDLRGCGRNFPAHQEALTARDVAKAGLRGFARLATRRGTHLQAQTFLLF